MHIYLTTVKLINWKKNWSKLSLSCQENSILVSRITSACAYVILDTKIEFSWQDKDNSILVSRITSACAYVSICQLENIS